MNTILNTCFDKVGATVDIVGNRLGLGFDTRLGITFGICWITLVGVPVVGLRLAAGFVFGI